ncbi:MAG: MucR family transcriptional regulator [Desulfobacterales bacterium]|nr:MucR family transcriptional regulator [Desulfobacterales bacterium]
MNKYNLEVKRKARKVLPGYPKTDKFETDEEVEAYFAGEKIQCLLCGKWYMQLHLHVIGIHGVTADEYRELYGLPWSRGLTGRIVSKKKKKISKQLFLDGKILQKRGRPPWKNKKTLKPEPPYIRAKRRRNVVARLAGMVKYTRKDFEAILDRMREQHRRLSDVRGDPDLPSISTWIGFLRKHPEFREKLLQAYYSMLYTKQVEYEFPSPQLFSECQRLRARGPFHKQIGRALGVPTATVQYFLQKFAEKKIPEK